MDMNYRWGMWEGGGGQDGIEWGGRWDNCNSIINKSIKKKQQKKKTTWEKLLLTQLYDQFLLINKLSSFSLEQREIPAN